MQTSPARADIFEQYRHDMNMLNAALIRDTNWNCTNCGGTLELQACYIRQRIFKCRTCKKTITR